ncbi:MAG TPA: hypothetical protein VHN11_18055 [Xanthobacteraceae bacterium]|nr:hypothetical protein [Xanthobacteraceae bacterium]
MVFGVALSASHKQIGDASKGFEAPCLGFAADRFLNFGDRVLLVGHDHPEKTKYSRKSLSAWIVNKLLALVEGDQTQNGKKLLTFGGANSWKSALFWSSSLGWCRGVAKPSCKSTPQADTGTPIVFLKNTAHGGF